MDELIDAAAAQRRFGALLMALFAAVAILLAMVGIFGVLANVVGQRTGELGIRMALGASPRGIITLVLRQAGLWIAGGITVGLAGALVLTRYLSSLLFHVKTYDPWTYLAAATFLAAVAAAAALIPAARGSRTDPIRALRYE
jgi:putative ABC transport system permease protein